MPDHTPARPPERALTIERLRTAADGFLGCTWQPGCRCMFCDAVNEIERLAAALQTIVDFQPEHEELGDDFYAEVNACEKCEVWRQRRHPVQSMCDAHLRRSYAVLDANAQSAEYQHYTLRDIARRALADASEGER